jgi:hypothetical protein
MAYTNLTYGQLQERFGIAHHYTPWLPDSVESYASPELENHYARYASLPARSEKARSELLVPPLLLGLWRWVLGPYVKID